MPKFTEIALDPASELPFYKQLAESIRGLIDCGLIQPGEKLPATRELAGQLGLNRTTVSAAYAQLEQCGLLQGHVGRGSFVARPEMANAAPAARSTDGPALDWDEILPPLEPQGASARNHRISFANSRPSEHAFPLAEFRRLAREVIDSAEAADILQLGSAYGYGPLRRYLLERAVEAGTARVADDLLITNGCQQALDLLARLFAADGQKVLMEDPVYHGLSRVFQRAGAAIVPVPVDDQGVDADAVEALLHQHRPRVLVVTPNFQNPTGGTLPLERRQRIVALAQRFGVVLIENDVYGELRYEGRDLPPLKQLDETGNTILLRSYSKVSFPGLRVGWVIAPRPVISRLADAKQLCDLHSDQLSQAVLLRFAESGELARHLERTRRAGAQRLRAALSACTHYLPQGAKFTRPEGGMNFWIELPAPLTAQALLPRVEEQGVTFLPGSFFSAGRPHPRGIRISFGSLDADEIRQGLRVIGEAARAALKTAESEVNWQPAAALV